MAFGEATSTLNVKIKADNKQLNKAINQSQSKIKGFSSFVQKHKKLIIGGFAAIGAAAVAMGVKSIKTWAAMGDEIHKMSLKTGFSATALSELAQAADLSGISLRTLDPAIRRVQRIIALGDEASVKWKDSLAALGLNAEMLKKQMPEEQFLSVLGALAEIEDQTMRTEIAFNVFGISGTELLKMLENGSEGLKEMMGETHELGIAFDREGSIKAAKFNDSLTRLNGAFKGLQIAFANEFGPALIKIIDGVSTAVVNTKEWIDTNLVLRGIIEQLTGKMTEQHTEIEAFLDTLVVFKDRWVATADGIRIAVDEVKRFKEEADKLDPALAKLSEFDRRAREIIARIQRQRAEEHRFGGITARARGESLQNFQHGGVVPGPTGSPVPIMAHGGERFLGTGNGGGMGDTFNFYIAGSILSERDFSALVRREIIKIKERNFTSGL